jgi:amino acid transporter
MTSLIFMLTAIALIVLVIRLIIKLIRGRPALSSLKIILIVVAAYGVGWLFFYWGSKNVPVLFGTEVCFDDWCATVTQIESGPAIQKQFEKLHSYSTYVIVHIRMLNQARGIAQTPSNPRVHILDGNGTAWAYSAAAQKLLETTLGPQPGIGHRLDLHQSLETLLVFAVPKNAGSLNVLIEEGPPITNLLFPEDKMVFAVK